MRQPWQWTRQQRHQLDSATRFLRMWRQCGLLDARLSHLHVDQVAYTVLVGCLFQQAQSSEYHREGMFPLPGLRRCHVHVVRRVLCRDRKSCSGASRAPALYCNTSHRTPLPLMFRKWINTVQSHNQEGDLVWAFSHRPFGGRSNSRQNLLEKPRPSDCCGETNACVRSLPRFRFLCLRVRLMDTHLCKSVCTNGWQVSAEHITPKTWHRNYTEVCPGCHVDGLNVLALKGLYRFLSIDTFLSVLRVVSHLGPDACAVCLACW